MLVNNPDGIPPPAMGAKVTEPAGATPAVIPVIVTVTGTGGTAAGVVLLAKVIVLPTAKPVTSLSPTDELVAAGNAVKTGGVIG